MTHRIYLRWPQQRTSDKTQTDDPDVAAIAFAALLVRRDLVGADVAVAWTADGKQIAYQDFAIEFDLPGRLKTLIAAAPVQQLDPDLLAVAVAWLQERAKRG